MTVHTFIESMQLGETYKVPPNCVAEQLKDYAKSRFGFHLIIIDPGHVKRVCSECHR